MRPGVVRGRQGWGEEVEPAAVVRLAGREEDLVRGLVVLDRRHLRAPNHFRAERRPAFQRARAVSVKCYAGVHRQRLTELPGNVSHIPVVVVRGYVAPNERLLVQGCAPSVSRSTTQRHGRATHSRMPRRGRSWCPPRRRKSRACWRSESVQSWARTAHGPCRPHRSPTPRRPSPRRRRERHSLRLRRRHSSRFRSHGRAGPRAVCCAAIRCA